MADYIFIPLTQGKMAVIDTADKDLICPYKWHASRSAYNWYAVRFVTVNGQRKKLYMHRVIANPKKDEVVHHKNGCSLFNRRHNLECCTKNVNLSYREWS